MMKLLPSRPQLDLLPRQRVLESLQTGDLLLFAGRGLVSGSIQFFTRSYWSHVGLVINEPGLPEPLILEATAMSPVVDVLIGKPVAGVALVSLSRQLNEYDGEIAVRRREGSPLSAAQRRAVLRLLRCVHQRPYKNYLRTLARDLCTGFRLCPDYSGFFCSELVAEFYRRLGWLPRAERSSRFVPGHFASPRFQLQQVQLAPLAWVKVRAGATASAAPAGGSCARRHRTAGHGTALLGQSPSAAVSACRSAG